MKEGWICFCLSLCLCLLGASMALAASVNYCDHPLFPLQSGNQWTYSGTAADPGTGYTLKVLAATPGQSSSTAIMSITFEGSPAGYPLGFSCDAQGIKLIQVDSVTLPLGDLGSLTLNLLEQQGVLLPPLEAITAGAPWSFKIKFSAELYLAQSERTISTEMTLMVDSRAIKTEDVVVPAGVFENSYVIEQDVTWQLRGRDLGFMGGERLSISNTRLWYLAPRVGPVQALLRDVYSQLVSFALQSS